MKFPQEYDDGCIIILDDLNEKEMNDPGVQAMFKRLKDLGKIKYLYSYSVKITMNHQNELSVLMVISMI